MSEMRLPEPVRVQSMNVQNAAVLGQDWAAHPALIGQSLALHRPLLREAHQQIIRYLWTTLIQVAPEQERERLSQTLLNSLEFKGDIERQAANLLTGYNVNPRDTEGEQLALLGWPLLRQWIARKQGDLGLFARASQTTALLSATGDRSDQRLLEQVLSDVAAYPDTPWKNEPLIHLWLERCIADGLPVGSRAALGTLMKWNTDIEAHDVRGWTALTNVCLRQNILSFRQDLITLLLEQGAQWRNMPHATALAVVEAHPFVRKQHLEEQVGNARPDGRPRGRL